MLTFNKTKLVIAAFAAVLLTACGGGGGPSVKETTISSIEPVKGDWLTYAAVSTDKGIVTDETFTDYFENIYSDGSRSVYETSSKYGVYQILLTGDFQYISTKSINDYGSGIQETNCSYSFLDNSIHKVSNVGSSFDINYNILCDTSLNGANLPVSQSQNNIKGSVVGTEIISTPTGEFDTFKIVYVKTTTYSSGRSVSIITIWREKISNQEIAYESTTINTPTSGVPTEYKYSSKLTGMGVKNFKASQSTVSRFAGKWSLNWTGSNSGQCPSIMITTNGVLSGSCTTNPVTSTYAISGNVDINGVITASLSTGALVSGNISNPISAAGVWTNNGASGSWTGSHL